jgi:adenosylcobinamide-phosphate synthase
VTSRAESGLKVREGRVVSGSWRMAVAGGAGMVLGAALDEVLGDPRRWHPVAGFGALATRLERRVYRDGRAAGARYVAALVGVPVAAAGAVALATRRRPVARAAAVAATTWLVLGGRSLRREAGAMGAALAAGDLDAARERLPHLCGRDPSGLDAGELARATVESVAENTSDAVVGALCWGALLGLPGLVGYRVVNTLDAMVGHLSPRYARFGWAAARLDDLANLAPARLTALLTVTVAGRVVRLDGRGGGSWPALRAWVRDGARHPSPNAGRCEAAMAGALGVRLGGRNVYQGRVEERPVLGAGGRVPDAIDVRRAARLSAAVGVAALALTAGHVAFAPARRRVVGAVGRAVAERLRGRLGQLAPRHQLGQLSRGVARAARLGRGWLS